MPVLQGIQRTFSPYIFTNPIARTRHKNYTLESLGLIWKEACKKTKGEGISLYAGLKHSTACQLVNDCGLSLSDLQSAGDWARLDLVERYAVIEVARRKVNRLKGKAIKLTVRSRRQKRRTATG